MAQYYWVSRFPPSSRILNRTQGFGNWRFHRPYEKIGGKLSHLGSLKELRSYVYIPLNTASNVLLGSILDDGQVVKSIKTKFKEMVQ
jgi:hypothetical protein